MHTSTSCTSLLNANAPSRNFQNLLRTILLAVLMVTGIGESWGQNYSVTYTFSSVTTTSGLTDPTTVPSATGINFGAFSAVGQTSTNPNATGRFTFTNQPLGATTGSDVFTGNISTSQYYQVTLTAAAGFNISVSSITFTVQRSSTGIRQYSVRGSGDSYSANLPASVTGSPLSVVSSNVFQITDATTSATTGSTITLSGSSYTNISAGSSVTFRFYGWNAEASGGSFSIDDVTFSGTATSTVQAPSISSSTNGNSTYGASSSYTITASNSPTSYNATNLPTGMTVNTTSGVIAVGATTAAGNYSITISATNSGGTGSATLSYTVNKASPTATVTVGSYTYNGVAQGPNSVSAPAVGSGVAPTGAVTWSYEGTGTTSYGPSSTRPTSAGEYTATATIASDGNYEQASSSATAFTIAKAALTVTANDVSKTEGLTLTGGSGSTAFTSSGLQNSETIGSVTITYGTSATTGATSGTYSGDATPSAATGGTFNADNYTISYVSGNVTVLPASTPLCPASTSIAPNSNQSVCVGGSTSQLTATVTTSGASGNPTYSYQWYYNTTNSNTISGAITVSGATSSTFTPATSASEAGDRWYFCVAYATDNDCNQSATTQSLASNTVKVTVNTIPAAPTGSASQSFCSGTSPTVASLTATGTSLKWYDASTSGTLLTSGTSLADATTYYASQTVNGCESSDRLSVTVSITSPAIPTGNASQSFCSAAAPTVASLVASGSNVQWFAAATGGSALASSAALTNGTTYYAESSDAGCVSTARLAVTATIVANPAAPTLTSPQTFCSGSTVANLQATGSGILWYTVSTGGTALATTDAL
ncbi:MAG: hypothetical protein RIQ47_470, partial [Bacteroidota bacterium]